MQRRRWVQPHPSMQTDAEAELMPWLPCHSISGKEPTADGIRACSL